MPGTGVHGIKRIRRLPPLASGCKIQRSVNMVIWNCCHILAPTLLAPDKAVCTADRGNVTKAPSNFEFRGRFAEQATRTETLPAGIEYVGSCHDVFCANVKLVTRPLSTTLPLDRTNETNWGNTDGHAAKRERKEKQYILLSQNKKKEKKDTKFYHFDSTSRDKPGMATATSIKDAEHLDDVDDEQIVLAANVNR